MSYNNISTADAALGAVGGHIIIDQDVGLAYAERGAGQPVVFVPHWTFTKEAFRHQLGALSGRYRVISYDPRGQGESGFSAEGNDYITHAHDLATLLETIGAERPVLVGWGTGALTSWNYVKLKGPAAVTGVVAIDMPPKPLSLNENDWREGSLDEIAAIHTLYLRDARGLETYLRRTIETVMIEHALSAEELSAMLRYSLRTSPLVAAQLFANAMFADLTQAAVAACRASPMLFFLASARAGHRPDQPANARSTLRRLRRPHDVLGTPRRLQPRPKRIHRPTGARAKQDRGVCGALT